MFRSHKKFVCIFCLIFVLGVFLRFYNIGFGLPYVTYADEDKLGNKAVVLSYSLKDIITSKDFLRLAPDDFVYGTFPIYLNSIILLLYKIILKPFGQTVQLYGAYMTLRIVNGVLLLSLVPVLAVLYHRIFKDKLGTLIFTFLLAFNWKIIVHSHYLNTDILLTALLAISFLTLYNFYSSEKLNNKLLILSSIFYGLAVGTKVTALITLPLYLFLIIKKSNLKNAGKFLLVLVLSYAISNPFTFIQLQRFFERVSQMRLKENGIVFDSADFTVYKYFLALIFMETLPVFIFSIVGAFWWAKKAVEKKNYLFHIFLIGNFLIYFLFFTISSRRVDRWILPILPIALFYAAFICSFILKKAFTKSIIYKTCAISLLLICSTYYLKFPFMLLSQFEIQTPQIKMFKWAKQNLISETPKILLTDTSLDPLREIHGVKIMKIGIYASQGAQNQLPYDPTFFEYVFVESRPFSRYQSPVVKELYPTYYARWKLFDDMVRKSSDFVLIKSFETQSPSLIPLSSIYLYKNLKYVLSPVTTGPVITPLLEISDINTLYENQ